MEPDADLGAAQRDDTLGSVPVQSSTEGAHRTMCTRYVFTDPAEASRDLFRITAPCRTGRLATTTAENNKPELLDCSPRRVDTERFLAKYGTAYSGAIHMGLCQLSARNTPRAIGVPMMAHDEALARLDRSISDMEERVQRQTALIENLAGSRQDTTQATRTLLALSTTLKLMREHQELLLSVENRRGSLDTPVSAPPG